MNAQGIYWYLEHVSTGRKIILQAGENTLGRHSRCRIVLRDFDFLSRTHAKITISSGNGVKLQQMNALNGVFLNEVKLIAQNTDLSDGDVIGLGVDTESAGDAVPANYAIFKLRQEVPNEEDTVLISDEEENDVNAVEAVNAAEAVNAVEDDVHAAEDNANAAENDVIAAADVIAEVKVEPEININIDRNAADNSPVAAIAADKSPVVANAVDINPDIANTSKERSIHLPMLPEVKLELLSQTTKEIENIFGEADEELLESVFQINPYVYKQLNNHNLVTNCAKISDGDVIELTEDVVKQEMPPPQATNPTIIDEIILDDDDEDYDEIFELSQAVLREIKEEMAEMEFDLSDVEIEHPQHDDFKPPSEFKAEMATQIDDDEFILIEDDDEELFSKVAGWSSKLLSQNVMSQIYPLDQDDENSSDEGDVERQSRQLFNDPKYDDDDDTDQCILPMKYRSKALRIDSSESEDDEPTFNRVLHKDVIPTPELPILARCSVRLKSLDRTKYMPEFAELSSSTDDLAINEITPKSTMRKRSKSIDARSHKEPEAKPKTSTMRTRSKSVAARSDLDEDKNPVKPPEPEPATSPKTPKKSSMRQRSKSVADRSDLDDRSDKSHLKLLEPEPATSPKTPKKSIMRKRSNFVAARSDLDENKNQVKLPEPEPQCTPKAAPSKSQMRKRSRTISLRTDSEELSKKPQKAADKKKSKESQEEIVAMPKPATIKKQGSSRLQNRSTSCYMERTLSSPESFNDIAKKLNAGKFKSPTEISSAATPETPNQKNLLNRSISCFTPSKSKKTEVVAATYVKTPTKEPISARLLNRSRSCYMERPSTSPVKSVYATKSTDKATRVDENISGPMVIAPPNLPKHRGKLRGVSAVHKDAERKKKTILERQRHVNYQAEMKAKWYQKPKDKKLDCEKIKDKRREQLKKLADKPKQEVLATDNERKRKHTNVPTLGNCNRGEFLTKAVEPPTTKKAKLEQIKAAPMPPPPPAPKKPMPKRRATIDSFSQQLLAADTFKGPPTLYNHLPERKAAEKARHQRTCNRVTFAEMNRDFELRLERDKKLKRNRHVRFNDNVQIIIIERIEGADKKVLGTKDTEMFSLSTYEERRGWALANGKLDNLTDIITGDIMHWANQWLAGCKADAITEPDVLMPIPTEFQSHKQYKDIIFPLMKVEILATIARDYKGYQVTFDVNLRSFSRANDRNRPRYVLITRYNHKPGKKFDLYTLRSGDKLQEIFASMEGTRRISENIYELTFEILQDGITMDTLGHIKTLTVRPVVDNIRVEQGALTAVHHLRSSPLFQRIMQPSENVLSCDNKAFDNHRYRGFKKLNENQLDICMRTWHRLVDDSTPSITLIQGPPGTGKSQLIANLTLQCMYGSMNHNLDRKILICAHSNAAVDNITINLNYARHCMSRDKFELLRFGFFEKMDMKVREVSLHHYLNTKVEEKRNRLSPENIECLQKKQNELIAEIAELKRNAQINYLQQQRQAKERELRIITAQLNPPLTPREEWEYSRMFLQRANIVCTTLSSCVKLAGFIDYFDACIIDEATQCTEPWTLLPLRFGVRDLVLVGDTQQLPATVLSQKAIDFGLGNSMFDRIQRNLKQQENKRPRGNHFVHTQVFKLFKQYRMHPEICKWPNKYFYEDQLVCAHITKRLTAPIMPYCVINLSYTRDTNDASSRSISNDEEARFVAKLLIELDKYMPTTRYRYGLITPYANQCYALSQVIPSSMKITPQTVDAYQGQERDVIILSNARTRGVGFLTNYQRLNVAITRPRRCLIICGNFDDLQDVDIWRHLLDDARKRKIYFDLKRSDVEDLHQSLISKILVKRMKKDAEPTQDAEAVKAIKDAGPAKTIKDAGPAKPTVPEK